MRPTSLASAVRLFLDWVQANRSPATAAVYRHYLQRFADQVGALQLGDLRAPHLLAFTQSFHAVQTVKRFCSWCCRPAGLLKRNPMRRVPLPRIGRRRRVLAGEDLAHLLRRSCAAYRAYLLALRETAARPAEMRQVTWANVRGPDGAAFALGDLPAGRGFFMLESWKTKGRTNRDRESREIPITPRLGRLLLRLWRSAPGRPDPIFRDTRGRPWTANAVRCQMRRLRDRAGLGEDLAGERICNYTLRHTAATGLVMAGAPLPVLQEILGHTQLTTTARYLHAGRADMLLAIRLTDDKKRRARQERRAR